FCNRLFHFFWFANIGGDGEGFSHAWVVRIEALPDRPTPTGLPGWGPRCRATAPSANARFINRLRSRLKMLHGAADESHICARLSQRARDAAGDAGAPASYE